MNNADRRISSSSSSPTQEKRSLSEQISFIGARINRALSRGRSEERSARDFDNDSLASSSATVVSVEGRGGIGNIVASVPEDAVVEQSVSPIRGRDISRPSEVPAGIPFAGSTGRGGAGNIRAPSQEQKFDSDTITLVPSRSSDTSNVRSPSQTSPSRNMLSTGRGGIGNIKRNPASDLNTSQGAASNEQNERE
ncbi:hypothetical protein F5876DRAFT_67542 [Lentinula aff. lateritia]|uniref:Uncharacterized protein n=1 Tax=Lentinula aff. lateritia TaxID=2804960 RepID=A0ACC1TTT4_9AGAR|nr:hypothetical protein F5876DRAFT_67542 [Lentinula aff. lateritia]